MKTIAKIIVNVKIADLPKGHQPRRDTVKHADRRTRRNRTRSAVKRNALRDQ